jgi:CRP/FNR family cyclic AMP-dependent transcriptional regulator
MTDQSLVETLRQITFLQGIADELLGQIAAVAQLEVFSAGHVIFREGSPATDTFLIASGDVSLEICSAGTGCRRVLTVSQGELLGWSPLLEQCRLTATARALTPVTIVRIPAGPALALCEGDPRLGYELMRRTAMSVAKRLSAARLQLLNVYGAETINQ